MAKHHKMPADISAPYLQSLFTLHINYENAKDYTLELSEANSDTEYKQFEYDKALERIIDQYKIKKIGDSTVTEQFNSLNHFCINQKFLASLKNTTVSHETLNILNLIKGDN
jgi:predicted helicase